MLSRTPRLVLALTVLASTSPARAERRVYSAYAGGGADIQVESAGATAQGAVILQSVYGFTDHLNLETPLFLEIGDPGAVTSAMGLEYASARSNHWSLNVGGGTALRFPIERGPRPGVGVYAEASVRWRFGWGVGLSLGVHLIYSVDTTRAGALHVYPGLTAFQEFW